MPARNINRLLCASFLLALVMAAAQPAYAQNDNAFLTVCNRGKVPVEAVAASFTGVFLPDHWTIEGTTIAPGDCERVYDEDGPQQKALIGFGVKNARGELVSGRVPNVPDWGTYEYGDLMLAAANGKSKEIILARSTGKIACVHPDATLYSSNDTTFPAAIENCRRFSVSGPRPVGSGGFFALTFALEFHPAPSRCAAYNSMTPNAPLCGGGSYFMNIVADPASGDVTVKTGSLDGRDAPPSTPEDKAIADFQDKMGQQFADAMVNAANEAEARRAAETAAADPMAKADAANAAFEEKQSHINYVAEHERNLRRIREISEFSPQWLSANEPLYVRGTVSRIELPQKRGQPARMYFKDSPDGAFIACVYPQLFDDLSQYVGERLEIRGRVTAPRCGAKTADLQVVIPAFVYELDKHMPDDEAVLPGMTISSPPNVHTAGGAATTTGSGAPPQPPRPATTAASAAPASAIPPRTALVVSFPNGLDLLHATDGATYQGQLAQPVQLRGGGSIPQGAAVVLQFSRTPVHNAPEYANASLTVSAVTIDGQTVTVSTNAFVRAFPTARSDRRSVLAPGAQLVFYVSGAGRATK